jgi:hypothetical protein
VPTAAPCPIRSEGHDSHEAPFFPPVLASNEGDSGHQRIRVRAYLQVKAERRNGLCALRILSELDIAMADTFACDNGTPRRRKLTWLRHHAE